MRARVHKVTSGGPRPRARPRAEGAPCAPTPLVLGGRHRAGSQEPGVTRWCRIRDPMAALDHKVNDARWQKLWAEADVFRASDADRSRPKAYILDMFPYPSGAGLHVGHPEGYTAT